MQDFGASGEDFDYFLSAFFSPTVRFAEKENENVSDLISNGNP